MMADVDRIARAARNNAEWCDAVTRSWGLRCRFEAEFWINPGEAPPFYPNVVTLTPTRGLPAEIAQAERALAVKDSFTQLDLAPLGFVPLFEAMWIWRDPQPVARSDRATWRIVRDAESLLRWEAAWRGGEPALDLFRPALLNERDHAFIAGETAGAHRRRLRRQPIGCGGGDLQPVRAERVRRRLRGGGSGLRPRSAGRGL
jgi:hypothetical protein